LIASALSLLLANRAGSSCGSWSLRRASRRGRERGAEWSTSVSEARPRPAELSRFGSLQLGRSWLAGANNGGITIALAAHGCKSV
jgi:hypothetical protein